MKTFRPVAPLLPALVVLVACLTPGAAAPASPPPNLVFIIADDMYRDMFNCDPTGAGRNLTPHLDRLAAEGVVLTGQHIVSPVCTPSRYNCLTGRYASRARTPGFTRLTERAGMTIVTWNTQIQPGEVTLPALLQKAGYRTGMVGKNHTIATPGIEPVDVTADPRDPAVAAQLRENGRRMEAAIRAVGFDYAGAIYPGNVSERLPRGLDVHNLDWITQAGLEFLDEAPGRPFFLYFAPTVVHSPSDAAHAWEADPRATAYGYLERAPAVLPPRETLRQRVQAARRPGGRHPEMLLWLDDAVGALLQRLRALGVADNTVVVFFNDNGQDGKGSLYESATACPSLVWREGGFPCGRSTPARVTNLDFAPTLLDLAGAPVPPDLLDGRSFKAVLEGRTNRVHDRLFFELGFTRAVLQDQWKYLALRFPPNAEQWVDLRKPEARRAAASAHAPYGHIAGNDNEDKARRAQPAYLDADQLYDLAQDPTEQKNLARDAAHAERLARMKAALKEHLNRLPGGFAELKPRP